MRKIILILVVCILYLNSFGQINREEYTFLAEEIPAETTTIHTNTNLLLAGEFLYYNVACLIKDKQTYSTISKIAYVELVGANETVIFKNKIKTDNSSAHGDFFIPTTIKTGHYKLISYTNWSKNNLTDSFGEVDLFIINPYSTEAQAVDDSEVQQNISKIIKADTLQLTKKQSISNNQLILNKSNFGKREKVSIEIEKGTLKKSNINSLSVRKVDFISTTHPDIQKTFQEDKASTYYLPELRGEIISGRLESTSDLKLGNITVYLSFPGENNIFKSTTTNTNGKFYFIVNENYNYAIINLQIEDKQDENFKIILDNKSFSHYNHLHFTDLKLEPNIKDWLEKESIFHQIENAYFSVKTDSILPVKSNISFYQPLETTFELDDYTRFKTVKETFTEIVKTAYISNKGSEHFFKVPDLININFNLDLNYLDPIILVDGLRILDNEMILNYSAYNIKNIQTVTGQYVYQSNIYNGIISFETLKNDFRLENKADFVRNIEFKNALLNKMYFQPDYSKDNNLIRIPDYRVQLLWIPDLKRNDEKKIDFYTSDVTGYYEVVLKSILPTGETEVKTTTFQVN